MEQKADHRRFSRVEFHITATVKYGDLQFVGDVANLSLRGMFVLTEKQIAVGEEVEITIALSDQPENELIINGKVARQTSDGIAFLFSKMDFDTYVHLKNVVAFNIGDEGKVSEEIEFFLNGNSQLS